MLLKKLIKTVDIEEDRPEVVLVLQQMNKT